MGNKVKVEHSTFVKMPELANFCQQENDLERTKCLTWLAGRPQCNPPTIYKVHENRKLSNLYLGTKNVDGEIRASICVGKDCMLLDKTKYKLVGKVDAIKFNAFLNAIAEEKCKRNDTLETIKEYSKTAGIISAAGAILATGGSLLADAGVLNFGLTTPAIGAALSSIGIILGLIAVISVGIYGLYTILAPDTNFQDEANAYDLPKPI